jgi:hypothetical protein
MMNDILKIVITAVISAAVSGMLTYFGIVRRKLKAYENGMLSLLRADIIRSHDKYMRKRYCPIYAKDALEKAYNAYHDLGGNGTITSLYNETIKLPNEGDDK